MNFEPKPKRHKFFVIPVGFEISPGEFGKFEDYPDAMVWGDINLADVLGTTRETVRRWRNEKIIPFRQAPRYTEFRLFDVVKALRDYGYGEDIPGNPTGVNR